MPRPRTQAELEAWIAAHAPVSRASTLRPLLGKASEFGTAHLRDHVELETEQGIETIEWTGALQCDRSHLLGSHGVEIVGQCSQCQRLLCSHDGCAAVCAHSGHLVCASHVLTLGEKTYCARHVPARTGIALARVSIAGLKRAAVAVWRLPYNPFGPSP